MAALSAALLALTAASAIGNARAQRQQGDYEAGQLDRNAQSAQDQATDALARGRLQENALRQDTKSLIGSQRARLGAGGVSVDSGSSLDVQTDAAGLGELDALALRNNARRQAFGMESDAATMRQQGEQVRTASRNAARSTLLTGALQTYAMGRDMGGGYRRGPNTARIGAQAASFGSSLVRGGY